MSDRLSSDLASLQIDRTSRPRERFRLRWGAILGACVLVAFAGYHYTLPYVNANLLAPKVKLTEIAVVSPAEASTELTATGYVVAEVTSSVGPKYGGTITKVAVEQGDEVDIGAVLAELDSTDDEAAIATAMSRALAASAKVDSAKAAIKTRQVEAEAALLSAERERHLADEGALPFESAEDTEARALLLARATEAAEAESRAAAAQAKSSYAEVQALRVRKKNSIIKSPIKGTVMNKPPQLGEFVGPQKTGSKTFEIADLSSVVVEADIPEGRLNLVKPGNPAEVVLDAYPQKRFRARVKEITPQVNRSKATVTVKLSFLEPVANVLPDMSARVRLLSKDADADSADGSPLTVIAESAVAERAGSKVTFVVDNGVARMLPVQLGERLGSGFVLTQGPAPGSRVVLKPPQELTDGQIVKERVE